ncbi:receptor-like protein kinase, partial [Trifolium pratense]
MEGFHINNSASLNPLSYPKTTSWNSSTDCCSWDGIKCDEHTNQVIQIDLSSSQLYGTMDANSSLFRLLHLRVLDLSDNDFNYSQIPPKIGELSQLRYLNLSLSIFSGEIPPQVSKLSKLLSLDLSFRAISSAKVGVFHLPNLKVLDLRYNPNLKGRLPEFQSSSLTKLALDQTGFYGTLPISIGNLSSLETLSIPNCHFFGYIPSSIGNLTQLMQINLRYNKFKGDPSASLANLIKLSHLIVGHNDFTIETISWIDEIPTFIRNLGDLEFLMLSSNNITSLPNWLWRKESLQILIASNSSLTGKISPSICNLKSLVHLELSFNKLRGNVPSCLGNFSQSLENLVLKGNKLSGLIPQTYMIGNSIKMIDLSNNNLQ